MKISRGFSLIELIATLVVLGIIAITVMGRNDGGDAQRLEASRDQVLLALRSARHLAMAKASAARSIELITDSATDSIDLRDGGRSVSLAAINYPLALAQGVEISAASFRFDKLGRTSPASITLSTRKSRVSITVSANGASQ